MRERGHLENAPQALKVRFIPKQQHLLRMMQEPAKTIDTTLLLVHVRLVNTYFVEEDEMLRLPEEQA
jgi:hypothetical protein